MRGISWVTGWINLSGWIALVATNSSLASTLVINVISLEDPNYEFERWHQFLIYLAITAITVIINAFSTYTDGQIPKDVLDSG